MTTISVDKAQEDFSGLVSRVEQGETIVLERDGKPVGQFGPVTALPKKKRELGFLVGKIRVPDDFDEMMRDEIEEMFYGKP
jgi:antitoxin (DNA-binding transcriptional repressor) of toxin-antitoxin stability system